MSNERYVELGELGEKEGAYALGTEAVLTEGHISQVEEAVPQFIEKKYECFTAKHAVVGHDLVIQFYLPEAAGDLKTADARVQRQWESFWLEAFRDALSPVAQEYFQAEYPRLVAKYTEELASWWFRARGFGDSMSPLELAEGFERRLNDRLQNQSAGQN
jgi:hypothetical protein